MNIGGLYLFDWFIGLEPCQLPAFVLILFLLFSLVYFDLLWSSSFHYR
jgi:hypothetical protein